MDDCFSRKFILSLWVTSEGYQVEPMLSTAKVSRDLVVNRQENFTLWIYS